MRAAVALVLIAECAGAVSPRTRELRRNVAGKRTVVGAGASAAIGTARNHPESGDAVRWAP